MTRAKFDDTLELWAFIPFVIACLLALAIGWIFSEICYGIECAWNWTRRAR